MIYQTANDWENATHKRVLFFGMSGLGKSYLSNMLRSAGDWYHYSIDYRIGTRYMGEYIADNAKAEAMKVPFLRDLLLSDSIYIGSNITFENLAPMSSYLGKPGNPALGGLAYEEYTRRQEQFKRSEISALMDTAHFISRAETLYRYEHFICDTGGSICEWVDAADPNDHVMKELSQHCLMVWIKGDEAHTQELIRRFDAAPKPMSYQPKFMSAKWIEYLNENNLLEREVNPDKFIRWIYAQALKHRQPRYREMAKWGITVTADEVSNIATPQDFDALMRCALERR